MFESMFASVYYIQPWCLLRVRPRLAQQKLFPHLSTLHSVLFSFLASVDAKVFKIGKDKIAHKSEIYG